MSYAELVGFVRERRIDTPEVTAPSGARYFVEFECVWDNRPGQDVRVLASISDGRGLRTFVLLTDGFIMSPEGIFVGG